MGDNKLPNWMLASPMIQDLHQTTVASMGLLAEANTVCIFLFASPANRAEVAKATRRPLSEAGAAASRVPVPCLSHSSLRPRPPLNINAMRGADYFHSQPGLCVSQAHSQPLNAAHHQFVGGIKWLAMGPAHTKTWLSMGVVGAALCSIC